MQATTPLDQGVVHPWLYVIMRGRVHIERSHPDLREPVILAKCGPGEVVGELGVLDADPREERVCAVEATDALVLSAAALAATLLQHPATAEEMLPILSRRLRRVEELARLAATTTEHT